MKTKWITGQRERKKQLARQIIQTIIGVFNLTMILEAALLLLCWKTPEDVLTIHIQESSWDGMVHYTEKLLDVENCLYYEYNMPDYWLDRDPNGENQGFQIVRELEQEKIARFFDAASRWFFWNWRGWYQNYAVCDGMSWKIIITYKNGRTTQVGGYARVPGGWTKVSSAFYQMTGEWM